MPCVLTIASRQVQIDKLAVIAFPQFPELLHIFRTGALPRVVPALFGEEMRAVGRAGAPPRNPGLSLRLGRNPIIRLDLCFH